MSETESKKEPEEPEVFDEYHVEPGSTKGSIAEEENECKACLAGCWKLWWILALVGFILTATFGGLYGWTMTKTE